MLVARRRPPPEFDGICSTHWMRRFLNSRCGTGMLAVPGDSCTGSDGSDSNSSSKFQTPASVRSA